MRYGISITSFAKERLQIRYLRIDYNPMPFNRFQKLLICLSLSVTIFGTGAYAQFTRGYQMTFGKNRVQYNDFLWTYYRFANFDTYYYLGGQELAQYTGRVADKEIAEIEQLFDYRINGRFQFVIYNKLSDFKQSNIGLEGEEANTNTGGLTKIIGSKVLIYFDGDYRHFREQIRAGVAQVMINQLMYGGSIKDRLQSAVLLNLPDWYVQGLISYVAKGWTVEDDNRMRDGINTGRYKKFNSLAGNEAVFAGQSLWNYVVETYGTSSVSNLIYMTRINRNIESGFIYVIGSPLKELTRNWLDYYQRNYLNEDKSRTTPPGKPVVTVKKPNRTVSQVKVSPDGNQLAYVVNNLGKYRVYLYDIRTHKRKRLSKGGYKSVNQNIDNSFPVLAWHPTGRYVAAIKEKKGKVWLDYYTPGKRIKRETNKFFYFDKVLDFSYSSSGNEIVLTGIQKGQSDIYTFNPRTKTYQQLTKDRWDDANPKFVLNDRYIIFNSTRTEDSLKTTSFRQKNEIVTSPTSDIYLFDYFNKSEKLIAITSTPLVNETMPMMIDSSHFSFLSDENGIVNRYIATLDSTIAFIDTTIHYRYIVNSKPASDYQRSILSQDVNPYKTRLAELYKANNRFELYLNPLNNIASTELLPLKKTTLRFKIDKSPLPQVKQVKSTPTITLPEPGKKQSGETNVNDSTKIDINNYSFQTDFPKRKSKTQEPEKQPAPAITDTTNAKAPIAIVDSSDSKPVTPDSIAYQMPKQRNYEIAFSPGYLLTQLDNSLLNETYQSYTGGAVYFDPGLNALFKIGLNDLMDDYRIIGGMRLSGNLNSNEYYASFENLKKRVDKQISFYRQSREEVTSQSYYKINTHELKYSTRYPLNDLASIRGSISYRNDRRVNLSTDIANLIEKNNSQNWGSARAEYVYDNTISTGLNLYNGLRFKLFAEYFNQVDASKKNLAVLGADFRYYLKIHRQLIWATRFATSTSLGNNKLVYYLGSTDNSFVPNDNFNYDIQVDQSQNYAFQAVATNLRGFVQNIRNGNSFALINSEIRFPIFQYLINKPIRSDFFRNFQIIGFGDIGTAWTGSSPYSKNNALFKKDYNGNPISISVTKNVEPIVGGYGFGLRTRLLGYFMRADWAWGVDDGAVQPRIFYFSLGLDF
jgi:hypothetical protein